MNAPTLKVPMRSTKRNLLPMKKLAFATAAVTLLLTGAASAADLAARPYTKAPPMIAAVYDWSGFYIGVNGGGGSSRSTFTGSSLPMKTSLPDTNQLTSVVLIPCSSSR